MFTKKVCMHSVLGTRRSSLCYERDKGVGLLSVLCLFQSFGRYALLVGSYGRDSSSLNASEKCCQEAHFHYLKTF